MRLTFLLVFVVVGFFFFGGGRSCRYVPIGVLERYPQRMNDKPLPYHGRDDMETLMASPNSNDWIRIRYVSRRGRCCHLAAASWWIGLHVACGPDQPRVAAI